MLRRRGAKCVSLRNPPRDKGDPHLASGLTAEVLNRHYAAVSADSKYVAPPDKQIVSFPCCYVTKIQVFRMLDHLRPTATGLDHLPAWFLMLGAPVFAAPLAQLFNRSLSHGSNGRKRALRQFQK